jgi:hypothetical protein
MPGRDGGDRVSLHDKIEVFAKSNGGYLNGPECSEALLWYEGFLSQAAQTRRFAQAIVRMGHEPGCASIEHIPDNPRFPGSHGIHIDSKKCNCVRREIEPEILATGPQVVVGDGPEVA